MTVLSVRPVTLRQSDGGKLQTEIEETFEDGKFVFTVKNPNDPTKPLGFISLEPQGRMTRDKRQLEIGVFHNATHGSQDKVKVHMGNELAECAMTKFFSGGFREVLVNATGSRWCYMSIGFEPMDGKHMKNCWRFTGAAGIHYDLSRNLPLTSVAQEIYDKHRKVLTDFLGLGEKVSFETVCRSEDLYQEMHLIFQRAQARETPAPEMDFPPIYMRMTQEGIDRWLAKVLSSTIPRAAVLIAGYAGVEL